MKCEVCGEARGTRVISGISICESCFSKIVALRNFDKDAVEFFSNQNNFEKASGQAQKYISELVNEKISENQEKEVEKKLAEKLAEEHKQIEEEKSSYAHSVDGYYEYDVVLIKNDWDGAVAAQKLQEILNKYAAQGWKLHSVYSNELGKNSLLGINATVSQDVLIFERRLNKQ